MEFEVINFIKDNFLNPQKRIFLGYLFSGFVIALLWLIFFKKKSIIKALKFIFSKQIYFSKSSFVDYTLYILNNFVMIVFSPILLSQLFVATFIFEFLHYQNFIEPHASKFLNFSIPFLFTVCFFIFDDFSKFFVHMLMHKIPFLWSFHKVHHSAEVLTPMTVFRTHPVEGIIFILRNAISQGTIIGLFYFISSGELSLVTILGANVFSFMFHLVGSNLRHSHISISYGEKFEKFLISPAQHQIHHSIDKKHHDKNFGVTFAIWDYIFGSLVFSKDNQILTFGLLEKENFPKNNLIKIYLFPILESVILISKIIFQPIKKLIINLYKFNYLKLTKSNKVLQNEKN